MLQRDARTCSTILPENVWAKMGFLQHQNDAAMWTAREEGAFCSLRSSLCVLYCVLPLSMLWSQRRGEYSRPPGRPLPSHMPSRALALWLQVRSYYELLTFHILLLL